MSSDEGQWAVLLAHEKWFVDDPGAFATDWGFAVSPLSLLFLAAVVAVTVVWRAVAVRYRTPELPVLHPLGRLVPYLPRLLAIHLGVSLLALAVRGEFLSPELELAELPAGDLAGLLEGALGIWFITGMRLRAAALGLIALGPLALGATGPVSLLETADLLGVAAFLTVLPPSDQTFGAVSVDPEQTRLALLLLRVGVGVALVALAFSEKFANPDLARATLASTPELNVFQLVGIPVSTDLFIRIAAATEVLFGLLVLSGAAPQVAVLVAGIPFNATLILFGTTEMLGHLPVYGVFLVLLAYGSHPDTAPLVGWWPRPARHKRVSVSKGPDARLAIRSMRSDP